MRTISVSDLAHETLKFKALKGKKFLHEIIDEILAERRKALRAGPKLANKKVTK